ncbi:strawberry notch C-terminal domain-containing protein [uncultured Tateyamaria sp.]|uniref:strawberry notch C-terminal domain-containing protein n=1 Tax=uncultured Tateyamaria sp. TaxID=455651 RepID=UPI0026067290|nr:strawberry notch C-terminal domain-containing protein [uncultured Tateyamaria sp.]
MAYFLPLNDGRFVSAIVENKHVDGNRGHSLAVWTAQEEGRARTRLRSALMRSRAPISEVAAANGGSVVLMPLRFANGPFWSDFIDRPIGQSHSAELYETDKLGAAIKRFSDASGFEIRDPDLIGRNRYGYQVYDRSLGRTAHKIGNHRDMVPEWRRKDGYLYGQQHPEMFFRAYNEYDLAENARSIFIEMANGDRLTDADIDQLASALSTADFQVRPRELMEHVEAEISRCIASGEVAGRSNLDAIMATFPRSRERTAAAIINQQYSTPYPFGLAASQIFDELDGKPVLEPTIGNGALAAPFAASGAAVTGFEIDHGRFIRATRALGAHGATIEEGNFLDSVQHLEAATFDFVLANPPFDKLGESQDIPVGAATFTTDRLHYAIAVEALQRLKPGGDAFFVLPTSFVNPEEKQGTAKRFHNLMKLSFDHVEEAIADGRLYQGMGTNVPVQVYAARGFRSELHPFAKLNDPEFVGTPRSLKTFTDLYEWADDCRVVFGLSDLSDRPANGVPSEPVPDAPRSDHEDAPEATETPASETETPRKRSQSTGDGPEGTVEQLGPSETTTPQEAPSGASTPVLEDDPLPRWLTDSLASDENQAYRPFSRAGQPSSVVPNSLSGAIYEALENLSAKLRAEHGSDYDVDAYVADALRIPKAELLKGDRLSPEQVDGVALTLDGMSEGRGVLIGDLMGLGKGREQGAVVESALADGDPVMFVTVKPSLFSDFLVRDLTDVSQRATADRIERGEINVHLINDYAVLLDRDEKTIYRQKSGAKGKEKYALPIDANVVASSYSQFQKADTGALRLQAVKDWLQHQFDQGRSPRVLLDEAHKAASPSSNTGMFFSNLCRFVEDRGGSVIWSSATGIKTGQHIDLYYSALPDTGLGKSELLEIMAGGDSLSLQEALSHEMAANGSLFVRQLADQGIWRDLPRLVDFDPAKINRVRESVDDATSILRDVIDFVPVIEDLAKQIAKEEFGGSIFRNGVNKLKLDTNSPVTNLHHFSGYLTLAAKGQFLEELVTDSLSRGEKPVFAIEHLGRSILDWKMARPGELKEDGNGGKFFDTPPNLADVLRRYVDVAMKVKATDALGNQLLIDLSDQLSGFAQGLTDQIDNADLAYMRVDGADMIHAKLHEMGLSSGELTGRTTSGGIGVLGEDNGRFYVHEFDKGGAKANLQTANRFNNGDLDALILNKSASTGISLHAAQSVGDDLRRRCMIKMELQADIVDERQIEGRVNRNGQVEGPRYVSPLTGFVSDDRLASLFNRKNRSLSASTNATRENSTNIDEVVDLLNPIGRQVVFDYLTSNPQLAAGLDIDVGKDTFSDDSLTRKLLGRLIVRPLDEQMRIVGEIDVQYQMRSEFLDRRGLNPNKSPRRDWRGEIVDQEVLLAENRASGMGAKPVYLTTVEAPTVIAPIEYDQVVRAVKRGLSQSQLVGDLPELMSKAFEENGLPKFKSRPWNKTVGMMDRSFFSTGETRDVPKMVDELQQFMVRHHPDRADESKLKSDGDKAKLLTLRNALMLSNLARHIEVGRAVFLNPALVPALEDTRLTRVVQGSQGEEGWIPAVVTNYSASGSYPLDPDYHAFGVAVPGEPEPIQVKLGNVARHLRSMDEFADSWHRAQFAVPTEDFLLRFAREDNLSVIQDWLVDHAENSTLFERAKPEGRVADKTLPKVFTRRPELAALYEALFDRTVAGEIMEQKTVLTGNMFRSMLLTRQKNGQSAGTKIQFSDSKGVWHHGIEVGGGPKNEKMRRIRDKAQVTASSSANITSPEQLSQLFGLAMDQDSYQPYYRTAGQRPPSAFGRVDAIYDAVGDVTLGDRLRQESLPPIQEGIRAPSCVFVGPDVFSEKLLEPRNHVYKGINALAGVNISPHKAEDPEMNAIGAFGVSYAELKNALASSFKELKRGEMYYFPLKGSASVIFNPKNRILQDEFPDLVELGSNKSAIYLNGAHFNAPTGMVGHAIPWDYDDQGLVPSAADTHRRVTEALIRLSEVAEQPVLLSGAARVISERLDSAFFEMKREVAQSLDVDAKVEVVNASRPKRAFMESTT